MRIIFTTLFIIILANTLSAQDPVDTTVVISGLSDISALDSKYPLIGSLSPNGGESYNAGENISVNWDASDYSSGVYLITLTTSDTKLTQKVLLLK